MTELVKDKSKGNSQRKDKEKWAYQQNLLSRIRIKHNFFDQSFKVLTAWKHLSSMKIINFQNIQIIVKSAGNKSVLLKMKLANMISKSSISLEKSHKLVEFLKVTCSTILWIHHTENTNGVN